MTDPIGLCTAEILAAECIELGNRSYPTHVCCLGDHDGPHECGCGHTWTEPDL